ncbi:MAG TPA: hypothetical protein PKB02_02530 [Anaerohalosphaeraceae bacterium]|nr:hypothetical protein [Anaerohalosphaeraceae bacterium]
MNDFESKAYRASINKYMQPEWFVIPQVRIATGFGKTFGGDRIIDAVALNLYPSRGYKVIAIEFKQTLSDMQKDFSDRLKQAASHLFSDEFWYAIPESLWTKERNSIANLVFGTGDGVYVFDPEQDPRRSTLCQVMRAAVREKVPMSSGFICSLIRNAYKLGFRDGRESILHKWENCTLPQTCAELQELRD